MTNINPMLIGIKQLLKRLNLRELITPELQLGFYTEIKKELLTRLKKNNEYSINDCELLFSIANTKELGNHLGIFFVIFKDKKVVESFYYQDFVSTIEDIVNEILKSKGDEGDSVKQVSNPNVKLISN